MFLVKNLLKNKLAIIAGATGDLGRAYLEHYALLPDVKTYGLLRRDELDPVENVTYLKVDLENSQLVSENINTISFDDISEIVFIHPVGMFKFEDAGKPEIDLNDDSIDDEVYNSNIETFHNVVRPILEKRSEFGSIPFTAVAFGSLSDKYLVPWWGSYSKSKLLLRKHMADLACIESNIYSVFVNLSSVKTSNEFKTRPYANSTYWISPEKIVEETIAGIHARKYPYSEINSYIPSPDYHLRYYKEHDTLKQKWKREMLGDNQLPEY